MRDIDYKQKYRDLRARFVNSMDVSFRMGYEKGLNDARQEQANQQLQQAQQMQQMQAQMPEQPMDQMQEQAQSEEMQPQKPSQEELDQYISELEKLVNKSELSAEDLKKSIEKIKNFQMLSKIKMVPMNKSDMKLSAMASANLTANSKKELSMQEKIIEDIMNKWEKEAPKSTSEAMQALGTEALTKKE